MTSELTIILFVLLLVMIMSITNSKTYILIVVIGLLGVAIIQTKNTDETFVSDAGGVDGDDTDFAKGQTTADFNETNIVTNNKDTNWDNSDIVNRILSREPESVDGDQRLFDKMKSVGEQSKEAILIRSRFTSDNFKAMFQEELDEQEKKIWWEDDSLDSAFVKDDIDYSI